mgnify:CR=1 FL=1
MEAQKTNLWQFREAKQATIKEHFLLLVFVVAGIIAIVRLANWWFKGNHIGSLPLFILLSISFDLFKIFPVNYKICFYLLFQN